MTPLLPAKPDSSRYGARAPTSKSAWTLAIILHALVIALLLLQSGPVFVKMSQRGLDAFMLPAARDGVDRTKSTQQQKQRETRKQVESDTPPPPPTVAPPPPEVQAPSNLQMPFIMLSREDFAASNISRMQSHRSAPGDAQQADSKAPYGPGAAPGGGSIYPADWFREPTDAELSGYIRPGQPSRGWGRIACKTVARYHVDECYILGESPMGSGYGRSVLNAAWQFLVQPPRVNGRPQVGAWVSILITYSPQGVSTAPGD